MRRIITGLIILLVFMTACQPTPEKAVVINKNTSNLPNNINSSAPADQYQAPDKYDDSFKDEKLEVLFDAEVQIPDADRYPLVKVKNAEFSQQQVDNIVTYLMEGKPLKNLQPQKTKAELEQVYIEYMAHIADVKAHPEKYELPIEEYEKNLELLKEQLENAPESVEEDVIVDSKLKQFMNGISGLNVSADLGKASPAVLMIDNRGGEGEMNFQNGIRYKDVQNPMLNNKAPKDIVIDKETALEYANEAVRGIGAEYMQFAAYTVGVVSKEGEGDKLEDYKQQCHMFYFTRVSDGIPTTYTDFHDPAIVEDSLYNQIHSYEMITVCIDDGGVSYLNWKGNSQILGYESENAALLPFNQIIEICKQQLINNYAWDEEHEKHNIKIKKITLGYMMISQKNNNEYDLLIPVWDFFGESSNEAGESYDMGYNSFVTLNALDGGVINRNLGY